jgi:AmmeMemoRadiSam system protein A
MAYDHVLTDDEKRELLRIARATLREFLASGRIPPGKPHKETLLRPAGAFVTLHKGDDLRGCIGTTVEQAPLYKTIQEMAVAAASRDPRFPPVAEDELPDLTIEISVLGGHREVGALADIQIGVHGLAIEHGGRRGLLLPQVATEHGWDAAAFVAHTCHKAGLPGDVWPGGGARLESFTAQVFDEHTHARPRA